ncbi:hypothetical protein ABMC88_05915 [Sulfitobacter sp. HNIBRBA2951]|uniref:hypothetical protein n=1 Tax=Sulfitobacter aquimarinus TaxID=3158557 RepID=UPI0032DEA68F
MSLEIARLSYEVSKSQLVNQKEDLKNLRNQASFCAAITGLIGTVFASLGTSLTLESFTSRIGLLNDGFEGLFVVLTFAMSICFSILVMTTWRKCTFDFDVNWILAQNELGRTDEDILIQLSKDADKYFNENERVLDETKDNLWWSLVLSWCQIPAWILLLLT